MMRKGFTIVELVVVIVVIGILAAITVFSYGSWRTSVERTQIETELKGVKTAMDKARSETGKFPTNIPDTHQPTADVTLTYAYGDAGMYCVQGQHGDSGSAVYYLHSSEGSTIKDGACPAATVAVPAAPTLTSASVTGAQASVAWSSVSGATSYELQYRRNSGAWTSIAATSFTSRVISSLIASSIYDFQVRASNTAGASAWSNLLTRRTVPTPTISSVTDMGCGNSGGSYAWLTVSVTWPATSNVYTQSYRLEGTSGLSYGLSPRTVVNTSGTGSLTTTASTTQWSPDVSGSGMVSLYGIGANGERSMPATWSSPTFAPYHC